MYSLVDMVEIFRELERKERKERKEQEAAARARFVTSATVDGARRKPLGPATQSPSSAPILRTDPGWASSHLKSLEENIPMRDLWNLLTLPASRRHGYFARREKRGYSPQGTNTLLAVAHWLWPYDSPAPGDVFERFYHPEEFRRDILTAVPTLPVPAPGEHKGPDARVMAGHETALRVLRQQMGRGQDPNISESVREGRQGIGRTFRGAVSNAANELTFHVPDMLGITKSRDYDNDPYITGFTRPMAGLGRDFVISAVGLRPVTAGASLATRFVIGGSRVYSGVNTARGVANSGYNVLTGRATWLDALNLAANAIGAKGAASTLRQQGAWGLWFHFTAEPRVGPDVANPGAVPGALHLDNTVMTGIKKGTVSATDLATRKAGAMVVIQKIREEASQGFREAYNANRAIYRYRISVIRNPTQADIDALDRSMSQEFKGGPNDQALLAAAKKHQGVIITGDKDVLRDALSAQHYDVVFALHHLEPNDAAQLQSFVNGMRSAEKVANRVREGNMFGIYKPTGKKGIPEDKNIPSNWVIFDWSPVGN